MRPLAATLIATLLGAAATWKDRRDVESDRRRLAASRRPNRDPGLSRLPHLIAAGVCGALMAGCTDMPYSSPGEPTCPECTITRTTVALVGGTTAPDVVRTVPAGVTATAGGNYLIFDGTTALEFGDDGEPVSGTTWSGGDERGLMYDAVAMAGVDSFVVADNRAGMVRLYGGNGAVVDSASLPPGARVGSLLVLQWPGRVIFSGRALGRSGVFQATIDDGFVILDRTFRPPRPPRHVRAPNYRLARSGDAGFWAMEAGSYTLHEYDAAGRQVRRVTRRPGWFPATGRRPRGRMPATVRALRQDVDGHVWIYSVAPNARAGPAWRSLEARRAGGTMPFGVEELYDTVVEVRDVRDMSVMARGRVPGYLVDLLPDARAVLFATQPDGRARLSVQLLRLDGG
jgi:hypothetical protein